VSLSQHLHLRDGLLHVQFILDGDTPYIVEVARRCPGDLYALLIEYSTGFEYASAYAAYFTGERHATSVSQHRHVLRHTVTSMSQDVYEGLRFRRPTPVRAFYPIQHMGQEMLPRQQSRSGVLFAEYAKYSELRDAYEAFMVREAYDVAW
jgi:biotin carboxylase